MLLYYNDDHLAKTGSELLPPLFDLIQSSKQSAV